MKDLTIPGSKLVVKSSNETMKTTKTPNKKAVMQPILGRKIQRLFACLVASAAVTNFVACAPGNGGAPSVAKNPQAAVTDGPGGTGGGDVVLEKSTLAEVEVAVDRAFSNLPLYFSGLAVVLRPFVRFDAETNTESLPNAGEPKFSLAPTDFAQLTTNGPLQRMNQIAIELSVGATVTKSGGLKVPRFDSLFPSIKLDKRRDRPCDDNLKAHHDGSADGMTICISLSRLTRIPNSALTSEVSALLAHELMHVLGYGEADAQLMQRYFIHEAVTGKVLATALTVNQFGYEIGYAKALVAQSEVVVPETMMQGFLQWTREADVRFFDPMMRLVGTTGKSAWQPRIDAHRDRMKTSAAALIALVAPGADPENKKLEAFDALKSAWLDAQKLAIEVAAIDFSQAQPATK